MTHEIAGAAAPPPKGADPRLGPGSGYRFHLTTLILAGGLTAALFSSRILLQEIQSQPDMARFKTLEYVGIAWNKTMRAVGATAPDRVLHNTIRRAESQTIKGDN